nr:helix-turn-helix transcriptional regulator [Clostridia bacterium]
MADVTYKDLADARKAAGMLQHQVGRELGYSADVISDWETGRREPHPDQVSLMEKLYKAPGLWHGWMREHYQSYRERYPENPESAALALSMVNVDMELRDVLERQQTAIRDALDGRIDDRRGFAAYIKETKELHAALGLMLAQAEKECSG